MSDGTGNQAMTAELRWLGEMLATPIDFPELAKERVLLKKGVWYAILDWARLPRHAAAKIAEVRSGNLVRFEAESGRLKEHLSISARPVPT